MRVVLADAIRHLRRVAATKSYGRELNDWNRTAQAVRLVADWYTTAASMPDTRVEAIAVELARALKDSNGDIRTQFWLGTMLAQAGLNPMVPHGSGRRPDFYVESEGVRLAVEVKMPRTRHSVIGAIESAAVQIRDAGSIGIVALDLSLALDAAAFTTGLYYDRIPASAQFRSRFGSYVGHLEQRLAGKRGRGRYGVLTGLIFYARTFTWHESDPVRPDLSQCTYAAAVSGPHADSVVAANLRVRDALHESANARSIVPPKRIRIAS